MASPPHRSSAASPPLPSHIPSKKRPSINTPSHAPNAKRQKRTSINSTPSTLSAHPLRQTSFPPEESTLDTGARSPSIDSDFTAVTGAKSTTAAAPTRRGRGKGKKTKNAEGSVKSGGREKTAESGHREGTFEAVEDEDEDDEGADGMVDEAEVVDAEAERKKMAVLMSAFNADQTERYTMLRRAKLKKETVRKIVNHAVSQSVPPAVITTINGTAKTFIGTLIERAREVQLQYALATPPPTPPKQISVDPTDFRAENPNNDIFTAAADSNGDAFTELVSAAAATHGGSEPQVGPAKAEKELGPLGPLLPDHFREALRRYKRDGEGGVTGLTGVSTGMGVPGSGSARLGGKRLFR